VTPTGVKPAIPADRSLPPDEGDPKLRAGSYKLVLRGADGTRRTLAFKAVNKKRRR
jgi:hypothetical protein